MTMRDQSWDLLIKHVPSERLLKHCLAVEADMRTLLLPPFKAIGLKGLGLQETL